MNEEEAVFDNLSRWLNCFELSSNDGDETVESLASGKPLAVFLHSLDEAYFDQEWLLKIQDIASNGNSNSSVTFKLRTSNLRKVWSQLMRYFEDIMEIPIPIILQPDIKKIAEEENKVELAKILRLLLFAAMESSKKEKYVEKTMKLNTFVQEDVMRAFNLVKDATTPQTDSDEKVKQMETELDSARQELSEMTRKCHELDRQVAALADENQNLVLKNETLSMKPADDFSLDDPQSPPGRRFRQLQDTLDRHQESLNALEIEKDETESKLEQTSKENEELKLRVEQLAEIEVNFLRLKDEADELRSRADQAAKLETTLATCKRKLEELSEVKSQNKLLQDKNEIYMKSVIQVEEEQRKNAALKQQLESQKRNMHEMEEKLSNEIKRADNADFNWKRLQEKNATLEQEKSRIETELREAKEKFDELRSDPIVMQASMSDSATKSAATLQESLNGEGPTELREKMVRLELENQSLKENAGAEMSLVKNQLEDALSRKQKLETELRLANQKTLSLEHQIKDLSEMQEKGLAGKDVKLSSLHEENERLKVEVENNLRQNSELSKSVPEKDEQIRKLEAELKTKTKDIREIDTKFKNYMEKARTALVGMEASRIGSGSMSRTSSSVSSADSSHKIDPEALKKEIEKKDKEIHRLQEENEKNRILSEQEIKLLTTSFHTQAVELQRQAGAERMTSAGLSPPHSLLNRQREITTPHKRTPTNLSTSANVSHRGFRGITKLRGIAVIIVFFVILGWIGGGDRAMADLDDLLRSRSSLSYVDGPPPI